MAKKANPKSDSIMKTEEQLKAGFTVCQPIIGGGGCEVHLFYEVNYIDGMFRPFFNVQKTRFQQSEERYYCVTYEDAVAKFYDVIREHAVEIAMQALFNEKGE